jgi:hypothetical protein
MVEDRIAPANTRVAALHSRSQVRVSIGVIELRERRGGFGPVTGRRRRRLGAADNGAGTGIFIYVLFAGMGKACNSVARPR